VPHIIASHQRIGRLHRTTVTAATRVASRSLELKSRSDAALDAAPRAPPSAAAAAADGFGAGWGAAAAGGGGGGGGGGAARGADEVPTLDAELAETHLREHSAVSCCRRASPPQWVTVNS